MFLDVRKYSRNISYCDEFGIEPVTTGSEPVSPRRAWAQHNEHRLMVSRLIMAGLFRLYSNDFRVVTCANVGLLSAMAASMLKLTRRLRGSARVTDAAVTRSFPSIAQTECLLIGFAMNLVLTSFFAVATIVGAGACRRGDGRAMAMVAGLSIVLLPLCGGRGLPMVPSLAAWLAGYVAVGWWSGRNPGAVIRAIVAGMLLASSTVVALYFRDYAQPTYHPLSSSPTTVAIGAIKYLSLGVYPSVPHYGPYWRPASLILLAVLIPTFVLLAAVALRTPEERPRSLGLMAVFLSMLGVACAVGVSRGGLGSNGTLFGRYVTLASPLLGVLYVAWLAYGTTSARAAIHVVLLALVASTLPENDRFSRVYGEPIRDAARRVELGLRDHSPAADILRAASPTLFPYRDYVRDRFRELKAARMGAFAGFEEKRVASTPDSSGPLRR
jgi:hypothetical protein